MSSCDGKCDGRFVTNIVNITFSSLSMIGMVVLASFTGRYTGPLYLCMYILGTLGTFQTAHCLPAYPNLDICIPSG